MAEKGSSQTQHGAWQKAVDEGAARVEAWHADWGKLESKAIEQAREAVDEGAKLMKASIDLAADLTAAWRQLGMEAIRRSTEMSVPRV